MRRTEHTGWQAIALAVPYVLVALAVTDATRVPWEYFAADVIVASGSAALAALWPFCLLQLGVAGIALTVEQRPRLAGWSILALAGIVLAMGLLSHAILTRYHRFVGDLPMIAAWVGFTAYLGATYLLSIFRPGKRWLRIALGVAGVLAGVVFWWATTVYYRYRYPALHRSAVAMTFLLWHAAAVSLASCAPILRERRGRSIRVLAAMAVVAMLALAMAPNDLRGATYVKEFTGLGQGGVLDIAHPPVDTCSTLPASLTDDRALQVFRQHAGLPALPESFSLADYNVLLVSAEAIRADATFAAGAPDNTPNLTALVAEGGFSFGRAYAPSTGTILTSAGVVAMTFPSHTHLVTKMPEWAGELMPDEDTIGDAFTAAGWRTFAYVHGMEMGTTLLGFGQGFEDYRVEPTTPEAKEHVDAANTDRAIARIDEIHRAGERFFGWVFYVNAHFPYDGRGLPEDADRRDRYLSDVRHSDEMFGRLVDHLRDLGELDRTVVIFFGDHGEELGEHGRQSRHGGTVHEVIAHVPLMVWIPGVDGRRIAHTTSLTYLFPWLLLHGDADMRALATRRIREHIAPMMLATDGAAVIELASRDWMRTALVWDRYKVSYNFYSGMHQLFDLAEDPGEQVDILGTDPTLDARYLSYMNAYRAIRACRWKIELTDQPIEEYLAQ